MSKRLILVVDDEDLILATLGRDLCLDEYNIETASSGEEALEKVNEQHFDLIISDFMMPGINGLQLLKKVRAVRPEVVFFILTGYGDSVSTLEILKNGADEMLLKPCDTDELLIRMERNLMKQDSILRLKEYEENLPICCVCGNEMGLNNDIEDEGTGY